jgi:hypothetical protein
MKNGSDTPSGSGPGSGGGSGNITRLKPDSAVASSSKSPVDDSRSSGEEEGEGKIP